MMRTLTDSELDAVAGAGLVAFAAADVTLGPFANTGLNASIILTLGGGASLALNALTAGVAGLAVVGPATVAVTSVTGATALTTV